MATSMTTEDLAVVLGVDRDVERRSALSNTDRIAVPISLELDRLVPYRHVQHEAAHRRGCHRPWGQHGCRGFASCECVWAQQLSDWRRVVGENA